MKFTALLIVTVLLIAVPALVTAQSLDRRDVQALLQRCEVVNAGDAVGLVSEAYCVGIVEGVKAVMSAHCDLLRSGLAGNAEFAADTGNVSTGAAIQAFENWATANPQNWSLPQSEGVMLAMNEIFPCG